MVDRVNIYSGDELVGSVPVPDKPPVHDFFELVSCEPFNLGIRRASFDDQFATLVTFKIKWRDEGWIKRATLHCDPMFGPGDWECIPGFRHERP